MSMSSDIILETLNLEKRFETGGGLLRRKGLIHAVNGVSLRIGRGETFAIVGESGCGKSTLARLLLRLIEPSAGSVLYEGRDLTAIPAPEMRRLRAEMQFIFQDPFSSLNPRMTVETIVGEPLMVHSDVSRAERARMVRGFLERVGLRPEHAGRYPHEFSGGQRQCICIARALATGPKLLIGDEPVSALDVSVQAQIVNLLEDLKAEFGLTLIVIAHDLSVIRHMSDRIAVMYLGEVVEEGPTEMLFNRPRHPYTRALTAAIPVPVPGARKAGQVLGGDLPSPTNPPPGCRFHTRCPYATEICTTSRPVAEDAGNGQSVSCHHWRGLAVESCMALTADPRSDAARRRFALYRAAAAVEERNELITITANPTEVT